MTGYEVRPAVASPADIEYVLERLNDPTGARQRRRARARGGRGDARGRRRRRRPSPLYDLRDRSDQLRRGGEDASVIQLVQRVIDEAVERGASDIHFEPQRRGDAGPLPHRRRAPGGGDRARLASSRRSPRASRSSPTSTSPSGASRRTAASRPRSSGKAIDLRVATLPAAVRRERRHAHPGLVQGDDQHGAARHAAAGARALHQGLQPVPRRRARHRPDRLGQVDVALRRAQPAQHDREEHHHDRGPGRVPARGPHPGPGQQEGRA